MSHKYKAGFLLNICVLMLCVLTLCMFGCGKEQPDADLSETEQITEPAEEDSIYITLYLYDESEDVPESTEGQKSDPNGVEGMNAVMVSTIGKDQLSAETIVSEYNRLIIASSYDEPLTVNEVREAGSQVWVDFDSESVKALQLEEGTEGQLFYNLARSIDDNLADVDDIYFTMDGGKDFTLGHLWFEADRPFYSSIVPLEGEEAAGSEAAPE